ncbi:NADH dehydrogenase [ubiquinone] 1 beta subcomplex subunit 2 [Cucurbita argyrosperma subsp. argyrosperma]|nr:NADH dehydrogenase [ubiquinone] 1 beta subcomplex subunit 2 [Cucurbita argyrosperma subsp. argyrosperma]
MGGGGHGAGTTFKGMTIHQPKRWHTVTGKGLCAVMWFWVLYRAKQDGPVVLYLFSRCLILVIFVMIRAGDIHGKAMVTMDMITRSFVGLLSMVGRRGYGKASVADPSIENLDRFSSTNGAGVIERVGFGHNFIAVESSHFEGI